MSAGKSIGIAFLTSLITLQGAAAQFLRLDKSTYTLQIIDDKTNAVQKTYIISYGKNPDGADKQKHGDNRTPDGKMKILKPPEDASRWRYANDYAYGPLFIRLKHKKWRSIGIHGTHEPYYLGKKISHGCIRMRDEDVLDLKNQLADIDYIEIK